MRGHFLYGGDRGSLGVDGLLSCRVGKLGNLYLFSLSLIDIQGARAVVRGSAKVEGDPKILVMTVEQLARRLLELLKLD